MLFHGFVGQRYHTNHTTSNHRHLVLICGEHHLHTRLTLTAPANVHSLKFIHIRQLGLNDVQLILSFFSSSRVTLLLYTTFWTVLSGFISAFFNSCICLRFTYTDYLSSLSLSNYSRYNMPRSITVINCQSSYHGH